MGVRWANARAVRSEVSLDGVETKSEDCEVDAGTYVAQATTTALIEVDVTVTESLAATVTFLEPVAGNA